MRSRPLDARPARSQRGRFARAAAPVAAAAALAPAGPTAAAEPDPNPAIVGGQPSGTCEWPSVVALQTGGLCTATLVHPRVIVYAAHCGTLHTHARFGEDVDDPAREVPILRCERASELFAVSSMDFAYCELAEPVTDVAVTPLLFGCEAEQLAIGTPVTIVGFGDTSSDGDAQVGIKHAATTQIVGLLGTVAIGGMGTGADSGDSGGPALVQLDDGAWRVLGIVSGGGGDGGTVQYVPAPATVAWIEARSGIDLTPCFAGDGSWAPTPACGDFFVATATDASWADGCPGPRSPASDQCGPAWADVDDRDGPTVSIIEPADGASFASAPVSLELVAEADDAGVGVRELRLVLGEGATIPGPTVDEVPPYAFPGLTLAAEGSYTLTVEATDLLGNVGQASVTVVVGDPGDEPGETGGSDAGDTDTGGEDSGGDLGSEVSQGGSGCTCDLGTTAETSQTGPLSPVAIAFIALVWRRRRRQDRDRGGSD